MGLWRITRSLNLLKAENISPDKIDIVVVIHGYPTYLVIFVRIKNIYTFE